jgi:hypothetical protein
MGILVKWDNAEQTILLCAFEESWSWNDYHAAMQQGREMMEDVNRAVDVIFDFQRTHFAPSGALRNLGSSFSKLSDASLNRLVIVGATGILHIIVDVLGNRYPDAASKMIHAVSIEQAYKLLGQGAGTGS